MKTTSSALAVHALIIIVYSLSWAESCAVVNSFTLSSIVPFSTICDISSTSALQFTRTNLTGVTFGLLESVLSISFDEFCILDGIRIEEVRVNQASPKKPINMDRFMLDAPLKYAEIGSIQVGGSVQITKRVIASRIGEIQAEGNINFSLPVSFSTFGNVSTAPASYNLYDLLFNRIKNCSFTSIRGGRTVQIHNTILRSSIASVSTVSYKSWVDLEFAKDSTLTYISSNYIYVRKALRSAFGEAVAVFAVTLGSVKNSTFTKLWGKGLVGSSDTYQIAMVHLQDIDQCQFGSIESGIDVGDYHNDYEIWFDGPVTDSQFDRLKGYPFFTSPAPLIRSSFGIIDSSSSVQWESEMIKTSFGSVAALGSLLIYTNVSNNVYSTFGNLSAGQYLIFHVPAPMELNCSGINAQQGCASYEYGTLTPQTCPVCV